MAARQLDALVSVALTGLLSYALAALPLAMVGAFRPLPVFVGTLAVWALLWRLWRSGGWRPENRAQHRATTIALLIVLVITGLNVRFSSQHVLTNRDPGVYNTTARWLANEGSLLVDTDPVSYRRIDQEDVVSFGAYGYYEGYRADGKLYPQFAHLLPAALAATAWLGGSRGMMKVNALLGALALLVFFAFASKILSPWPAVGAVTALAMNLVQVHFSRDSYAEIMMQILIFGGLWALWEARRDGSPARAAVAGLLVGASCMTHVDGFVVLVGLGAYILYEVSRPRHGVERRRELALLGSLALGATVSASIGFLDLRFFSPIYLRDLWPFVRPVLVILVVLVLVGWAMVFVRPRLPAIASWAGAHGRWLSIGVAVAIVAAAVFAYVLRPEIEVGLQAARNPFVEGLQRAEGLAVDGRRTFAELTLRWIGLYLGPAALWVGVVGLALICRAVVLGRHQRVTPFLFLFFPISALYIWAPHITPDHLWAMRRFLPVTIPGLILGGFWLLGRMASLPRPAWASRVSAAAATVLALWTVGFPAWVLSPAVTERTQLGLLAATEHVCRELPDNAAVLVAEVGMFHHHYTQTVRSFCRVPAASAPMDQPLDWYQQIARRWQDNGRPLYLLAPHPAGRALSADPPRRVAGTTYSDLEKTLNRRPVGRETQSFDLFLLELRG